MNTNELSSLAVLRILVLLVEIMIWFKDSLYSVQKYGNKIKLSLIYTAKLTLTS